MSSPFLGVNALCASLEKKKTKREFQKHKWKYFFGPYKQFRTNAHAVYANKNVDKFGKVASLAFKVAAFRMMKAARQPYPRQETTQRYCDGRRAGLNC